MDRQPVSPNFPKSKFFPKQLFLSASLTPDHLVTVARQRLMTDRHHLSRLTDCIYCKLIVANRCKTVSWPLKDELSLTLYIRGLGCYDNEELQSNTIQHRKTPQHLKTLGIEHSKLQLKSIFLCFKCIQLKTLEIEHSKLKLK